MTRDLRLRPDVLVSVLGYLTLIALVAAVSETYLRLPIAGELSRAAMVTIVVLIWLRFAVREPVVGVLFLAMLLNVANYTVLNFSADGTEVLSGGARLIAALRVPLVVATIGIHAWSSPRRFLSLLRANWDVVLFGTSAFLGVFISTDPGQAGRYALWLVLSLTAALVFVQEVGLERNRDRMATVAATIGLCYAPVVLLAARGLPTFAGRGYLVADYLPSNIYAVGGTLVLGSIAAVLGLPSRRRAWFSTTLLIAFAGLALPIVLLSAKRSAIVAMALILCIAGLREFARRRWRPTRSAFVIALLAAGAVGGVKAIDQAQATQWRFTRLVAEGQEDSSVVARLDLLKLGREVFYTSPLVGVGLTGFGKAVGRSRPGSSYEAYSLHNTYLAVPVEMGIVGTLLFLIMVFRSIRIGIRNRILTDDLVTFLLLSLPALLYGVTEYNLTPGQIVFWPVWIAILLPRMPRRSSSEGPSPDTAEAWASSSINHEAPFSAKPAFLAQEAEKGSRRL